MIALLTENSTLLLSLNVNPIHCCYLPRPHHPKPALPLSQLLCRQETHFLCLAVAPVPHPSSCDTVVGKQNKAGWDRSGGIWWVQYCVTVPAVSGRPEPRLQTYLCLVFIFCLRVPMVMRISDKQDKTAVLRAGIREEAHALQVYGGLPLPQGFP